MKFLKFTDYIGKKPKLKINGEDRFKTHMGGVLSIIGFIAILCIGGYFFLQTFLRTNMKIISSIDHEDNPVYDFIKYPPYLMVVDGYQKPIKEADRIYSLTAIMGFQNVTDSEYRTMKLSINKDLYFRPEKYKDEPEETLKNLYYFDMKDPENQVNFTGTWGKGITNMSNLLTIYINKCVNTTENNNNCKTQDEINNALTGSQYVINYPEYVIDHNNQTEPGSIRYASEDNDISPTVLKKWWFGYNTIYYQTDYGFVFEDFRYKVYWGFLPYLFDVELIPGGPNEPGGCVGLVGIYGDTKKEIYTRSYGKLQELIANLGGVIKGVILVATFINDFLIISPFQYFFYENIFYPKLNYKLKEVGLSDTNSEIHLQNYFLQTKTGLHNTKNVLLDKIGPKIQKKLKLSFKDYLCPFHLRDNEVSRMLKNAQSIINKKISIETIIEQMNMVDKIKFCLFSENDIHLLHLIPKQEVTNDKAKKKINELWSNFDFNYFDFKVYCNTMDSFDSLDSLTNQNELTKKIISLI